MQRAINRELLTKTAENIWADLGSLDDLPEEVANTVANIYYRQCAYLESLKTGQQNLLYPYLDQSNDFIENISNFSKLSAETISSFDVASELIEIIRDTDASQSRNIKYMVDLFIDTFKFGISDADKKTFIRRWVERRIKKSWVIDGLYVRIKVLKKSKPESPSNNLVPGDEQKNKSIISDLHWSAARGDRELTVRILNSGVPSNIKMSSKDRLIQLCNGATPLHLACANGNVSIVEELLRAGANPNMATEIGDTPLHWALDVSDELVDELLHSGANCLQTMKGGEIALHWACCTESVARWGDGYEEPVVGYLTNDPLRTIKILLDAGSPINQRDNYGWSPLHWRTQLIGGPNGIVSELVRHGADLHATNNKNQTPLVQAIMSINPVVVEELLENNASIPIDFDLEFLISYLESKVKTKSRDDLVRLLVRHKVLDGKRIEVIKLLDAIDTSGCFFSIQSDGRNKLNVNPSLKILGLLLNHGANINAANSDGVTPLMVAAGAGNSALKIGRAFTDIFYRSE